MEMAEDLIAEIEKLNSEISDLVKADSELRPYYQAVEGAFVVAELIDALSRWSEKSVEILAFESGIDSELAQAAIGASCETPTTLRTLILLAQAAGFRCQIQLLPAGVSTENSLMLDDSNNTVLGEVATFPYPFQEGIAHEVLFNAFIRAEQFAVQPSRPLDFCVIHLDLPVWELFSTTEELGLRLQFRASPNETENRNINHYPYINSALAVEISGPIVQVDTEEVVGAGLSMQRNGFSTAIADN